MEQRYKLSMHYSEDADIEMTSNFVTWESKDGLRYRFNERRLRNGEPDEEIKGEAKLDGKPLSDRHSMGMVATTAVGAAAGRPGPRLPDVVARV